MNVEIRRATLDDSAAISGLTLATCRRFLFPDLGQEGRQTLLDLYAPGSIHQRITAGDLFTLARVDDQLAAAAAMRPGDGHIYLFFVDGKYHRQGLGRMLMDEMSGAATHLENLTLNSSVYARDFYLRLGFVPTGEAFESKGLTCVPMKLNVGGTFAS